MEKKREVFKNTCKDALILTFLLAAHLKFLDEIPMNHNTEKKKTGQSCKIL